MSDVICYEVSEQIATITIDRLEKRGAMNPGILFEFLEAVRRYGASQ